MTPTLPRDGVSGHAGAVHDVHTLATSSDHSGHPRDAGPEDFIPQRIERFRVAPAGSGKFHPATAALNARDRVADEKLELLTYDRAYVVLDDFLPAATAHATKVAFDLHPSHRAEQAPYDGALVIDGAFFSPGLPAHLQKIRKPDTFATQAEHDTFRAACDERAPYAFSPKGRSTAGSPRYNGPARRNKVRCVNWPASLRLPLTYPETKCKPGDGCPCGKMITDSHDALGKARQWPLWGTSDWYRIKGQRNMVETHNSLLKRANVQRHYTHVFGLPRNALLLAFALAALNILAARNWRRLFGRPSLDGPDNELASDGSATTRDVPANRHEDARPEPQADPPPDR